MNTTAESRQRLWIVPASPVIWSLHFMACYITAALWCGVVVGREGPLTSARAAIGVYTVIALAAIAAVGWLGWRAHRHHAGGAGRADEPPHDDDTPEDRHRFLGFATVLLSGLSGVATIYSALAAVFIETCQ